MRIAVKAPFMNLATAMKRNASQILSVAGQRLLPRHIPISFKLAFVITVLIVSGMGLLGLWMIGHQSRVMQAQLHDFGLTQAQQLAEIIAEPILSEDNLALRILTKQLAGSEKVLGVAIYSDTGAVLSQSGLQPAANTINPLLTTESATLLPAYRDWVQVSDTSSNPGLWWSDANERRVSFIAPVKYQHLIAGFTVVTLSASLLDDALNKARNTIVVGTLLMSLLATVLAFLMSRRLSQPIRSLMRATQAIDQGDFSIRIDDRRNDEIGFLIDGFNNMAEGLLRKSQVENVFSRYVSKKVADQVLANLHEVRLGSRHVQATVLFADIVGFTSITERLQPAEVSELLNEYFSYISVASKQYHGTIDKFIGDCAMVVFGPVEDDPSHAFHAVSCAILIQHLAEQLNIKRHQEDKPLIHFRIGINSGLMLAGNLGSDERMEYTVVGDAVNLASRLSSVACSGQIIVCESLITAHDIEQQIEWIPYKTIGIRGKSEQVKTCNVLDVHMRHKPVLNANLREVLASKR